MVRVSGVARPNTPTFTPPISKILLESKTVLPSASVVMSAHRMGKSASLARALRLSMPKSSSWLPTVMAS